MLEEFLTMIYIVFYVNFFFIFLSWSIGRVLMMTTGHIFPCAPSCYNEINGFSPDLRILLKLEMGSDMTLSHPVQLCIILNKKNILIDVFHFQLFFIYI